MQNRIGKRRIVITGAAGRIGAMLRQHLNRSSDYEFILLDHKRGNEPDIRVVDLSSYLTDWIELFEGVDTVIHLAGDPRPLAPWKPLAAHNIEATINVFRAAARYKVSRVIFASSMQTMEGYRYTGRPVPADAAPRPVSFYGASKLMGESIARFFTEEHGVSAICLRIGNAQTDQSPPDPAWHHWAHYKWLSAEDLCQAMEKAILAEGVPFAALPLVSDNEGMPWDLSETRRILGYSPAHGTAQSTPPLWMRFRQTLAWAYRRCFDPNWRAYWE